MPNIAPVFELRNYGKVLLPPVFLTKNGRVAYNLHNIEDDEELEKARGMVTLMTELIKGFHSGEVHGWLSDEELDRHFTESGKHMLRDE